MEKDFDLKHLKLLPENAYIAAYYGDGIRHNIADTFSWLVEQAERAQELESELDSQINNESILNKEIGELRAENKQLRKALEGLQ